MFKKAVFLAAFFLCLPFLFLLFAGFLMILNFRDLGVFIAREVRSRIHARKKETPRVSSVTIIVNVGFSKDLQKETSVVFSSWNARRNVGAYMRMPLLQDEQKHPCRLE